MKWYDITTEEPPKGTIVWLWLEDEPYYGERRKSGWIRYDPITNEVSRIPEAWITHWAFIEEPKRKEDNNE